MSENRRRTNLTPPLGIPAPGLPPTRRAGGARRDLSERVFFFTSGAGEISGWALNISRGGLRAIVEDPVELGADYDIAIGEEDAPKRRGRIVWIQEEPDGAIVGVEFQGISLLEEDRGVPPMPAEDPEPIPSVRKPEDPSDA